MVIHIHSLDKGIKKIIIKKLSLFADKIIFPSHYAKNKYKLPKNKAEVIFNAIKVSEVKKTKKKINNEMIISYVGSIEKYKGILIFCEVAKSLIKIYPNLKFKVLGDGTLLKEIKDKYLFIDFLGFHQEVELFLKKEINLLIFPSIVEETFGLSILEALVNGVKVVAFDIGGQAELVRNLLSKNYLVKMENIDSMVKKIKDIIENNEDYPKINFEKIDKFYSEKNFSKEFKKIFSF